MDKKEFSPTWMYLKAGPVLCLTQEEYDQAVRAGAKDDPAKVDDKPTDVKPEKKGK